MLSRGDGPPRPPPYRFFDENGDLLALRSDMTVPIARLVATRFADAPLPLRLCYLASAYRAVPPQRGEMREFVQAGIELIGAPGADGTAEVIGVLGAALDAAGLDRAVIGLGHADLYRKLLDRVRGRGEARDAVLGRLATHDLVGLEAELSPRPGSATRRSRPASRSRSCAAAPTCSSAPARSAATRSSAPPPACRRPTRSWSSAAPPTACRSTSACCATSATTRGAIFEVYDPALGHVLGGGGRYDGFLANFGLDLPAAGFSLYLERVHVAQMEEESRRAERAAG